MFAIISFLLLLLVFHYSKTLPPQQKSIILNGVWRALRTNEVEGPAVAFG
jgi:hypothetical protein